MVDFVLVHGAWHGGWCWRDLEPLLQAKGHRTHALTLTGLGERAHLLSADISPDTHVQDVANTIKYRELDQAVLVGHSYGGMIIEGVASLMPERIASLVYLDAMVPTSSSDSIYARRNPERFTKLQAQIDAGAVGLEPDLFHTWSKDPEKLEWLKAHCTPQPTQTFLKGVTLSGDEQKVERRLYVRAAENQNATFDAEFARAQAEPNWRAEAIDCLHDIMVERPVELAALLCDWVS